MFTHWRHHRFDHHLSHLAGISAVERDGLWLIAVGALLIACATLFGGHVGGLSGTPVGHAGKRSNRLVFAVSFSGAVLVAVGSVIAAVEAFPTIWPALLTLLIALVMFWIVAAWRLHVDIGKNLEDCTSFAQMEHVASDPTRLNVLNWDIARYTRQLSLHWCLRHAFSSETRARADAEHTLGARPQES